ncbi:monovalent cation/H+ antiporter subunit D family protein [Citricoccus nitrophenolicus]|uniref:monovalent cation/H+ antiporter subunit D family protein n=1 Tax=Citricoccus nitrophenolicus TaxID=863575 RepID=UPI00360DC306
MIGVLIPLLIAVPLLCAGALIVTGSRRRLNTVVLLGVLAASTAAGVLLVLAVRDGGVIAHEVGLWPAGIAIPLAVDMFSALMITVTSLLSLTCAVFAVAAGHAHRPFFAPLVLVLTAGVNGALLTADLFNLFVFIEVMLLPSYALLVLSAPGRATADRVAGTRLYVTVNLLTSTLFLAGVGFVYGVTGTVNLGELAAAATDSPAVAAATGVCLFALSIKAAVVPVHGWLARAYPAASPVVTALFSGLHTKVAIYAIYRIYAVVFDGQECYLWIGVAAFTLTMVIGVLGAVGQNTMRSILAFHMVSQIGYILLGVALFSLAGLAAGIFYLLHHMIVKASLFLSTGALEIRYGTGSLDRLHGMARREPLIAVAFFAAALSLAGIPPFSGFLAKLTLIIAAVDAGQIIAAAVAIIVSLITLQSMLKIWSRVFWGKDTPEHPEPVPAAATPLSGGAVGPLATEATVKSPPRVGFALAAPSLFLALVTLGLGVGGELLLSLTETAATGLLDTTTYTEAVSGR